MMWRLTARDYERNKGRPNCSLLHKLVDDNEPLGIIAFEHEQPVGWCSISPRNKLERLNTTRLFKSMDDAPVWSITCLFIQQPHRKKGVSSKLIREACIYASGLGATIIEAYPVVQQKGKFIPDLFAYNGLASAYAKAGFEKVKQPSLNRLIMRLQL
jgi:hypothetical protein